MSKVGNNAVIFNLMVLSDVDVLEDSVFDDGCWSFYSILMVKIGLLQKKKI